MTDLRQAAQQALHELEGIPFYRKYGVRISNAITALRAALAMHQVSEFAQAQEQAEPVAWMCCVPGQDAILLFDEPSDERYPPKYKDPLYTTPPQRPWVGLTDEQLDDIAVVARRGNLHDLRIAIEAKLKEKNSD